MLLYDEERRDKGGETSVERRTSVRLPVHISIKYYLWNPLFWKNLYGGTIENLSEQGMFICTDTVYFPRDSLLEVFMPLKKGIVSIPVKSTNIVWRSLRADKSCDGIGLEFSNPPEEYIDFVKRLKSAASSG